jgi:hypothetical protein
VKGKASGWSKKHTVLKHVEGALDGQKAVWLLLLPQACVGKGIIASRGEMTADEEEGKPSQKMGR